MVQEGRWCVFQPLPIAGKKTCSNTTRLGRGTAYILARLVAFVLGARALGGPWPPVGGWDVISVGASAAFALPSHCGQVTLAMSTVSSSCGAWMPQTARPLLVSFSSRLPSLVEYDQCR